MISQHTKGLAALLLFSPFAAVLSFTLPTVVQRPALIARPLHSTTLEQTSESGDLAASESTPNVFDTDLEIPAAVAVSETSADAVSETSADTESVASTEKVESKKKVQRVRHTAFVGNLPYDVTEDNLQEMFGMHGTVELINLPKDRDTMVPRGFAFVDLSSEEELQKAIGQLDGDIMGERTIRVSKSVPRSEKTNKPRVPLDGKKVYVGNIPFSATKEDLLELFEAYGEPMDVYIPMNRDTGMGRGFCFVTLKEDQADLAIEELNGVEFDGRNLVVNEPLPPGKKPPTRVQKDLHTKIYVGNLSFYTVPNTLLDLFGEFGEVFDCYFPTDRETGATRGFAFVSMDEEAANNAIAELDGCEVDDRVIRVNLALSKPQYVEMGDGEE